MMGSVIFLWPACVPKEENGFSECSSHLSFFDFEIHGVRVCCDLKLTEWGSMDGYWAICKKLYVRRVLKGNLMT